MVASVHLSTATRNVLGDALADLAFDSGSTAATIKLYSGTQPATANTSLSGNTLLATFTLDNPAFGNSGAVNPGEIVLAGVPLSATGAAAGTATFARIESTGTSNIGTVMDVNVGTADATLILNTTTISVGVDVDITAGTFTIPAG